MIWVFFFLLSCILTKWIYFYCVCRLPSPLYCVRILVPYLTHEDYNRNSLKQKNKINKTDDSFDGISDINNTNTNEICFFYFSFYFLFWRFFLLENIRVSGTVVLLARSHFTLQFWLNWIKKHFKGIKFCYVFSVSITVTAQYPSDF